MSKYPLKKIDPPETSRQSSVVMTLSLFIMLLSFFLIMNANVDFSEARVQSVLRSIEDTFTTRVFRDGQGPSTRADAEHALGEGQALESMDAYFRSTFPGFEPQMIPSRGIMSVTIEQAKFEQIMFGERKSYQKVLIEKMWSYDMLQMEIWLNIQEDPGVASGRDAKSVSDMIRTTASWATNMEVAGLDKGRLTIGIKQGKPGFVTVLFRNYKPYAPMP
jgi:hypothetical protein